MGQGDREAEPPLGFVAQSGPGSRDPGVGPSARQEQETRVCPYPGSAAFSTEAAPWFFGRDRELAELLNRLGNRLRSGGAVAVVGPQGSGKSSLLQAGLLPALAAGALPGVDQLPVPVPFRGPMRALAARLAPLAGIRPALLAEELTRDPETAVALLREAVRAAGEPTCLVLVVDELLHHVDDFTESLYPGEWQACLRALSALAEPVRGRERPLALVVFGVRSARTQRWTEYPRLAAALRDPVRIEPLTGVQLREAIELPAGAVGLAVEPSLVEVLLQDLTGGSPDLRMSLLQQALRSTWLQHQNGLLTVADYQATGGIAGILSRTAEGVFDRLDEAERRAARDVLHRLVRVGDDIRPTRRQVPWDTLAPAGAADVAVRQLLQAGVLSHDGERVEIAHDALLTHWPRLREWLESHQADNLLRQDIEDAAAVWERYLRDRDALYRGTCLAVGQSWVAMGGYLSPLAAEFIKASVEAAHRAPRLRAGATIAASALLLVVLLTAALLLLLRALPAADGWWFLVLWGVIAVGALLTARRTDGPRSPSPTLPRPGLDRDPPGSRTGAFLSGLLDVWLPSTVLGGPDHRAPLRQGSEPPSRERALRNVVERAGAYGLLPGPPQWLAPAPGDPSIDVERGER